MLNNMPWSNPLNSRYQMNDDLGEGGLSTIYEVTDMYDTYFENERKLAVKLPSVDMLKMQDIGALIYAEYNILRDLNHPYIIDVKDFGIDKKSNVPYMILEFLEGRMLADIALYELSDEVKDEMARQIFVAIDYLHEMKVIHADINPKNIMLLDDGNIKVFDFGISQHVEKKMHFQFSFANAQAFNPLYSAPEVLQGKPPSLTSDIFSTAVIIYELYQGVLPYQESSLELDEKSWKKLSYKKVPRKLRSWLKKALKVDPHERVDEFWDIME